MNNEEVKDTEQEQEMNEQQQEAVEQSTEVEELKQQLQEKEDSYLRLFAEFDNFRKRSAKERIEQGKLAGKDIIADFLPVLDDIYRAQANISESTDVDGVKQGVELILNKLLTVLSNKGLAAMEVVGEPFDPEIHEAITEIPAPSDDLKGKVVDQVEKGYRLNDVIIRYPKVVVGK